MKSFVGLVIFLLILTAGMFLGWERVAEECDQKGKFKNHGAVYSCHKTKTPTGEKE